VTDSSTLGPENVIEVRGLVSRFGDHLVHDHLSLDVKKGEILGVVGGSGSGKTVLLNTIIGLKSPDAGSVSLMGSNGTQAPQARARSWGVMFQQGALFSALTVRENIAAPMYEFTKMSTPDINELVDVKLALVGLRSTAAGLKPAELSGGMRKRVGLARALALDPQLLFLDEPTAGLDPIAASAFDQLILDLSATLKLTVFMITHDLDSLYAITDRVAVLADKQVVASAPVRELERSEHPWIREYFLGSRGRAARQAADRSSIVEETL
jgi:phospholipid/cholesterol/gamma-HCH transport system ATP-binding protein